MKISAVIVAVVASVFAPSVTAQPHHGMRHFDHHQRGDWGWVAPAVIGGAVVYGLTRPAVVQQPVYIQQPVIGQSAQVVIIDGIVYTRQVMVINGVAQEVLLRQ